MEIIISNSNGIPIYEQIKEQIKVKIVSNELKENELLPSIRSLAKDLRCSVITTKNAYEELGKGGYVKNIPSKGFYVAKINKDVALEEQLNKIEELMDKAVVIAKMNSINKKTLNEILNILYEEDNMGNNELEKLELERNKLLLSAENIIGFTSTIAFLSSIFGAVFGDFSDLIKAVFIVSGTTIFVSGISFALKIEQKAGYYRCSKCEHTYVPEKYSKVYFAPHLGMTRYMECPECGEKSWQKKVLIKKQK